jgi:hypothetical protein
LSGQLYDDPWKIVTMTPVDAYGEGELVMPPATIFDDDSTAFISLPIGSVLEPVSYEIRIEEVPLAPASIPGVTPVSNPVTFNPSQAVIIDETAQPTRISIPVQTDLCGTSYDPDREEFIFECKEYWPSQFGAGCSEYLLAYSDAGFLVRNGPSCDSVFKVRHTSTFFAAVFNDPGDMDGDGDIDILDIRILYLTRANQPADDDTYGPGNDPRDMNGDGMVTIHDARMLVPLCTRPGCATE